MKIELTRLAHARSGDKGDTANVGVIAFKDEFYPILVREVTAERVKEHFGAMVKGEVERFEPKMSIDIRSSRLAGWSKAVAAVLA